VPFRIASVCSSRRQCPQFDDRCGRKEEVNPGIEI
jgi:hypothetical protein